MEKILENYSEKTYDPESTCGKGVEPQQIRGGTQSPGYPNTGRTVKTIFYITRQKYFLRMST